MTRAIQPTDPPARSGEQPVPRQEQSCAVAVEMRDIRRTFRGGVVAIERLSLRIAPGEFVAILGPSGCGKSTLLRIIAGLDRPDSGSINVIAHPAAGAPARPQLAFVFQDAHLLPWRHVLGNVQLPLELMRVPRARRRAAALEAIEQVGLGDAIDRYPAQLSGGMRMRVSLARALVTDPSLLLLDEPFAALDEITRQQLDEQLHQLWRSRGMTVIFVTHSIVEAAFLAQRAVVLSRRPARIVLDHTLALPEQRVAELRGEPSFAAQTRVLLDALRRGEGAGA
ncbi:ABC transporter ATP-binding protein [Fontivita pretiosa]|uniref:ABC transporter ATP-binding protein n=1 Tax=Fontivita pretiosa TaxID=2989684 RepID=UPI003D164B67